MTAMFRIRTWRIPCSLTVALVLAIGCSGEKPAPNTEPGPKPGPGPMPGAGPTPTPSQTPGAPSVTRPLEDIEKDVKPPVVVKPE